MDLPLLASKNGSLHSKDMCLWLILVVQYRAMSCSVVFVVAVARVSAEEENCEMGRR